MKVTINKTNINTLNDKKMRSGDLVYSEDSKEYFQVIWIPDLKREWVIYNLSNHTYMCEDIRLTQNDELSKNKTLLFKNVVERLNSRHGNDSRVWKYVSRDNYDITLNINEGGM